LFRNAIVSISFLKNGETTTILKNSMKMWLTCSSKIKNYQARSRKSSIRARRLFSSSEIPRSCSARCASNYKAKTPEFRFKLPPELVSHSRRNSTTEKHVRCSRWWGAQVTIFAVSRKQKLTMKIQLKNI